MSHAVKKMKVRPTVTDAQIGKLLTFLRKTIAKQPAAAAALQ